MFSGGIFSLFTWVLIALAIVWLASKLFRSIKSGKNEIYKDRNDSLEILKQRYAKGELSQEEYFKMKKILFES
jgi:putative membrane protein